jgi:hypothetical protein
MTHVDKLMVTGAQSLARHPGPGSAGVPRYRAGLLPGDYHPWDARFHVKAYPSKDGGLSVFFHDITPRKRSDEARGVRVFSVCPWGITTGS